LHEGRKSDDQIVVYFDNKNKIKHFGKLVEDRVVSKWGRGLVWKHRLFEVPLSYGIRVMYSNGKISENALRKIVFEFQKD